MILNALTIFTRATIYTSVATAKFTYSLLSTTLNICRGSFILNNTVTNTIANAGKISSSGTHISISPGTRIGILSSSMSSALGIASVLISYCPYIFIFTGLPLTMSYKKIIALLLVKSICGI